jgi:hypothetical protein
MLLIMPCCAVLCCATITSCCFSLPEERSAHNPQFFAPERDVSGVHISGYEIYCLKIYIRRHVINKNGSYI